jgi:hypothetical protein
MYQNKIIDITAIIADATILFDKMIKTIHIKVGKDLTGQVAYG